MCVLYVFKKSPGLGYCPVKGCRNQKGAHKKLCHKHHQRLWRYTHPIECAYATIKHGAKVRKIPFSLTLAEFTEFVTAHTYLEGRAPTGLHLDRIRDELGYSLDNIQVLTGRENVVKEHERRKAYVPYFQNLASESNNPF